MIIARKSNRVIIQGSKIYPLLTKIDFNLRSYLYIFAARSTKNAGVAQLVRAQDYIRRGGRQFGGKYWPG